MAERLTAEQFDALAQLLRLLEGSAARDVAWRYYVDGADRLEIAAATGVSAQKIYDAIKRVERGLALARRVSGDES